MTPKEQELIFKHQLYLAKIWEKEEKEKEEQHQKRYEEQKNTIEMRKELEALKLQLKQLNN